MSELPARDALAALKHSPLSAVELAYCAGVLKSRDEMDLEALADFLWGGSDDLEMARFALWGGSDDLEMARFALDAAWGVADE